MRRIYLLLTACASVVFILSCQKDIHELEEIASKCRIETGYYYGGSGMMNDSAIFTYTADSKLSKVETEYEYWEYYYTGDKITARKLYDKFANELLYVDSIQYDGDKLKRIAAYDYGMFGFDTLYNHVTFTYQGNRLTDITYQETYPFSNTDPVITKVYQNAAGNIEKLVFLDEFNEPYDSIQYQFDANPNYFKLVHPHFILFDPFFQLHAGFEPHLAYFYSTNNVAKFSIYDNEFYDITYDLDSAKNVSGIKMDGEDYMRYRYSCK